jgi:hypothetical protein
MVYDIRNKPEGVAWKEVESNIYAEISKAKTMDNYAYMNIITLIYCSSGNFNFDSVIEDKERAFAIKKAVDPKNIFYINGVDGLKSLSKKITKIVTLQSKNYYKNVKIAMKKKKSNFYDDKDKQIKYSVKLAILSQIK